MKVAPAPRVHVISHTHWDREWYLTREQYRLRLVDLVDGVLDRMDHDDEFRFFHLDGQTIVLGDYLEVRPDQEARLRRRIAEGRLLVGPWYVMPDMHLVSGEALVRNLSIGHLLAESFGGVMRAGYTPDPFGHVAQMPQILAGFGLDNAILWRGFGGPNAEYIWEGHDGTRALLLHLPREGYCNAFRLPLLPAAQRAAAVTAAVERERARSSTGVALLMAGVDHIEPHPQLMGMISEAGPGAALSTLPAYVDDVRTAVAGSGVDLETVRGELRAGEEYSHLLPGVLSARTYLKKSNVRAQALLEKTVEPLALFAWLAGEPHPTGALTYAWKTLLENHPHDSICGCSIDEVHDENETRFARVLQVGEAQAARSLRALARRVEPGPAGALRFLIVNTDGHPYAGPVAVTIDLPVESLEPQRVPSADLLEAPLAFFPPDSAILEITDAEGQKIGFQEIRRDQTVEHWASRFDVPLAVRVERLHLVCDVSLPAAGFEAFDARVGSRLPAPSLPASPSHEIENDVLRIVANDDGTLNVHDKRSGVTYPNALELEDVGDVGDEYNYSPPHDDRRVSNRGVARARVALLERGPLSSALQVSFDLETPASATADRRARSAETVTLPVTIEVRLNLGSPVVACVLKVDNRATDHRLRILFPTGTETVEECRADSAFAVLSRPARRPVPANPMKETPVSAAPLQSFVDAGDDRVGMTVLSEGLMEYEIRLAEGPKATAGIALSLLRCVGWLSRDDLRTREGNAGPSLPTPGAQCPGSHEFRFAFVPRAAPPVESALCAMGSRFLAPPRVVVGTSGSKAPSDLPRRHSFLAVDCQPPRAAVMSALKKADEGNGVVLRLFSPGAEPTAMAVASSRTAATQCDLRERDLAALPVHDGATRMILGPRKIATIKLT